MKKTLYISDLDGTLLAANKETTDFTNKTINTLVDKGMLFSYATARSFTTSYPVTRGIKATIPVIVYNGTFIISSPDGKKLFQFTFENDDIDFIKKVLSENDVQPIIHGVIDANEYFSYNKNKLNDQMKQYLSIRIDDDRNRPCGNDEAVYAGEPFYFTCVSTKELLEKPYEMLKEKFQCVFEKDIYSDVFYLEIMPKGANKASAMLKLKEMLGCERVVCFGDGENDLPMFEQADECYAMENASPVLKKAATAVIGKNTEDGVAKWLVENFKE